MALHPDPSPRVAATVSWIWARGPIRGGTSTAGAGSAGRFGRGDRRRPRLGHLVEALGEFFGLAIHMNPQDIDAAGGRSRWVPRPLVTASVALHVAAAATAIARPHLWPGSRGAGEGRQW